MITTLGDWAQRAPDDMLNKMQMDCAQWRLLPAWLKPRQFSRLDIGPYGTLTDRGVTPNERRPIVPTLSWGNAADVANAIRLLDRHCAVSLQTARSHGLAPADLASAYTTSASYTNGPTLLAASIAFVAGYATSRLLRTKR